MIEEHIGLLVNTKKRTKPNLSRFRMSHLQMYYIEDISTIYELRQVKFNIQSGTGIFLVYTIDPKNYCKDTTVITRRERLVERTIQTFSIFARLKYPLVHLLAVSFCTLDHQLKVTLCDRLYIP